MSYCLDVCEICLKILVMSWITLKGEYLERNKFLFFFPFLFKFPIICEVLIDSIHSKIANYMVYPSSINPLKNEILLAYKFSHQSFTLVFSKTPIFRVCFSQNGSEFSCVMIKLHMIGIRSCHQLRWKGFIFEWIIDIDSWI